MSNNVTWHNQGMPPMHMQAAFYEAIVIYYRRIGLGLDAEFPVLADYVYVYPIKIKNAED